MSDGTRIGVLGLGAMGLPMAARLASGDFTVRGFDAAPGPRPEAERQGVEWASTPADAAEGADVLLLAVRDGAQAEAALLGGGGAAARLGPDAVVLLTSTIGPPAARALAERLDVAVVDAPVSGGPRRAGEGDLLVVVGGAEAHVEAVRPLLDRLASSWTVAGPRVGDGQLLKVINQLLAGVHIAAAAEAVALADAVGLDPATVVDTLSGGAAASFMLSDRGPRIVEALSGDPEVRSRIDIFVKDMGLVADLAGSAGVPTPLAATAAQLYRQAERAGLGGADDSTVVRLLTGGAA